MFTSPTPSKRVTALFRITHRRFAPLAGALLLAHGCGIVTPVSLPGASGLIYGDGSSGAKVIAANSALPVGASQYTNFTINAGVTLTVPSGSIIRCTGTFTNRGTIVVGDGAIGTTRDAGTTNTTVDPALQLPDPGVSLQAAGVGELGSPLGICRPGRGGVGLSFNQTVDMLHPGVKAGGAGAGGIAGFGGNGGGSLTVLARIAINNTGTGIIHADATDGAGVGFGGGAGGVVILASADTITNNGAITCNGGNGGAVSNFTGPGGAGGGGIIHLLAPTINGVGTTVVNHGTAGTNGPANSVTSNPREGGSGGGACGGNGGGGGSIEINNTPNPAGAGGNGNVVQELLDPSALF